MPIATLLINWTIFTFIVTFGYENLSDKKATSQYKIDDHCKMCDAGRAVDGDNGTCMRTGDIGKTSNDDDDKKTWWYVDLGEIHNVFNIRILFKNYDGQIYRQRGRFAGFSLFVSNTSMPNDQQNGFLCYKNGQELPSLDFNTNCTTHGRYVIFYNERLDKMKYPSEYQLTSVFTELCEVTVTGCSTPGQYGNNCSKRCPENCQEGRCYIINGTCLGCTPGWIGEYCNNTCNVGYYGLACSEKCAGHCKDNEPCDHINGTCHKGCHDGWTGEKCDTECPKGTYVPGCTHTCSGHCLNDAPCNRTTGKCDQGCDSGYTGIFCEKKCEDGTFGKDCMQMCSGYCKDNETCNSANGYCLRGCVSGYIGNFCNKTCDNDTVHCKQNCFTNCVGGLCNNIDGSCICKNGEKYPDCIARNEEKLKTKTEKIETNTEPIIGAAAGGGVCVIILIIVGVSLLRRRQNKKKMANNEGQIFGFSANNESLIKGNGKKYNETGVHNMIYDAETKRETVFDQRPKHLDSLIKDISQINSSSIRDEYKAIPKGELHPCVEGKRQENMSKNRYTTIFPYDHSRVVLDTSTNESDYINANYIEDVFGKKTYIATQGPKNSTIADFWRMVWQENARIIVCLTNINEAKTKKCAKYWPDLNDKNMEGDISVRCQKEQTYAENIIRHLRIKKGSESTERDVFMFHYTQWPDHGVPEPLSLVVFHRHVMKTVEEHPMGYILVHCSAGIGRTGTFIGLDALYKEGERTGKVNVPQYVEKMRNARMNMIQGEDQYKTVYMALLEAFRGRLRAVPVDFFLKEFQDNSCYLNHGDVSKKSPFAVEFEELMSFRKVYTHEDYKSGMSNIAANYVPSVLPVERYICPLTNSADSLYYNAVCLQSFTQCDRFISAQFPLPDYTEHFLTLVKTYYTCTIVSLYPLAEVKSTSIWLPTKNQQKTVGPFTVKLAESTQAKYVAKTNITLQQKGGSSMRVAVLECRGWEDEYDSKSRRILIDLVQEAKIEGRTHPTGRILVLSSDGAKRCGPFCAVFNGLEQMMMDEEVDLFTITRQLQTRRPEFLSSLEEYQFCFDTISDYLQNDTLYANV